MVPRDEKGYRGDGTNKGHITGQNDPRRIVINFQGFQDVEEKWLSDGGRNGVTESSISGKQVKNKNKY